MRYLVRRDLFVGDEGRDSIIRDMIKEEVIKEGDGGKVYSIFKYLYTNTTRNGAVSTTLKAIVEGCGYKPRGGKYNMNNQFKAILHYLDNHGYLGKNGYDFSDVSLNEHLIIPMDSLLDVDKDNNYRNLVVLEAHEEETIRGIEGVDSNTLEAYFLVIKARMNNGEGKLQVSYASIDLMASNIGISVRSAKEYNRLLKKHGLILIDNAGSYSKSVNGGVKYAQANNTYALASNENAVKEIKYAMREYTAHMASLGYKSHGSKKEE